MAWSKSHEGRKLIRFTSVSLVATATSQLGILILYGIIGPKSLRSRMKRLLNFFDRDSTLFFPYDHTKPSKEALNEMVKHPWPTRARVQKASRLIGWYVAVAIGSAVASIILIGFLTSRSGH